MSFPDLAALHITTPQFGPNKAASDFEFRPLDQTAIRSNQIAQPVIRSSSYPRPDQVPKRPALKPRTPDMDVDAMDLNAPPLSSVLHPISEEKTPYGDRTILSFLSNSQPQPGQQASRPNSAFFTYQINPKI